MHIPKELAISKTLKKILDLYQQLSPCRKNIFTWLLFAIITFALYGKTISFNYCIDDQYYLWLLPNDLSNFSEVLQSITKRFWGEQFRPTTYITILSEVLIFGNTPKVHHFFNLLYYSLLCFVIFLVVSQLFNQKIKHASLFAFCTSLLFLLHPSHANIVASIKNREVILSLLFGLLALSSFLKYFTTNKIIYLFLSPVLLLIGVMAKKDIATFIVIIPVIGLLQNQKLYISLRQIVLTILFITTVSVSIALVTNNIAQPTETEFTLHAYENEFINQKIKFINRIPYAFQILAIYEKFMVVPNGYHFYFGYNTININNKWNLYSVILFLVHFTAICLTFFYFLKHKKHYHLIGLVWFLLAIAPFCISFATGYVAVRYSFIASLGFCIILSQVIFYLAAKLKTPTLIITPFIVAICLLWSYYSFTRSLDWKDLETLYENDLPKLKNSANANRMAATYYYLKAENELDNREENLILSQKYANQALKIYTPIEPVLLYKAKGLLLQNKRNEANKTFEELTNHFNNLEANQYLAYEFKRLKQYQKSIKHFEKIVALQPKDVDANIELTQLYIFNREFDKALTLNKSLYNKGFEYDALLNIGDILIAQNDTISALKNYNQAISIKKEKFILEELLKISISSKNDTMIQKLEKLLSNH